MVQLWVVIGLAISAASVSCLGAYFSIVGLSKLFAADPLSIWLMAGSLELAKFVSAAFLHQAWTKLGYFYKGYMTIAVIALSAITSVGIFGYLSDSYQESSSTLEAAQIKLESIKEKSIRLNEEIARLNNSVNEIPDTRISKKLKARADVEPLIKDLTKKQDELKTEITESNLKILEIKNKVGPLIYIAKMLNVDIDQVVKYLIFLLVSVFDPLAICLVIAVSKSIELRKMLKFAIPQRRASDRTGNDNREQRQSRGPEILKSESMATSMTAVPTDIKPPVSPPQADPIINAKETPTVMSPATENTPKEKGPIERFIPTPKILKTIKMRFIKDKKADS